MSDRARQIAERVVNRLNEHSDDEVTYLRGTIEKLNSRINQLETQAFPITQNSKLKTQNSSLHPSTEKFNLAEAVVEELVEFFEKEKTCTFEPNGKACDHCSMCSSRGF